MRLLLLHFLGASSSKDHFTMASPRAIGFWGDSDSDGSDVELPAVTPLDNEKEDFDFYG